MGLAVPLGVLAAWRAGTWIDRAVMIFAVGGFSIPVFWLGFLMIYGFSVRLDLFPVQGYAPLAAGFGPVRAPPRSCRRVTLGLIYMALLTRITRASVLEVLDADYVRTAHAKGQWPGRILFTHALKNAAVPIVTTIGVGLTLLISGVVITESVFALPGLGRLTADAVLQRDYSIIQGVTLLSSAVYVVVNLLVDLCYLLLDPRIPLLTAALARPPSGADRRPLRPATSTVAVGGVLLVLGMRGGPGAAPPDREPDQISPPSSSGRPARFTGSARTCTDATLTAG